MIKTTCGVMQASSPLGQPRLEPRWTVLKPLSLCVEHHTIIGRDDDTGMWVDAGHGLVQPMQRHQRQERCMATALGRPCGGGSKVALFEQTRCEPGVQLAAEPRGCLHLRPECLRIAPIEALRTIQVERMVRSKPEGGQEGSEGIRAGPSWAQASGVR